MNLYRLRLTIPGSHSHDVVLYRLGVAAMMAELRRARRWGYVLAALELG